MERGKEGQKENKITEKGGKNQLCKVYNYTDALRQKRSPMNNQMPIDLITQMKQGQIQKRM